MKRLASYAVSSPPFLSIPNCPSRVLFNAQASLSTIYRHSFASVLKATTNL